jgi:hypothetical protein
VIVGLRDAHGVGNSPLGLRETPLRDPFNHDSAAVVMTDATVPVGVIVAAGGTRRLFDAAGKWVGSYPTRQAVMGALPQRRAS